MGKRTAISFIFCVMLSTTMHSQTVFTDLQSLEKRGDYYYSKMAYSKAADLYTQALKKKKNKANFSLNLKAATLYRKLGRYKEAEECFENSIASGHTLSTQNNIEYFNVLRAVGNSKADTIFTNTYSRIILNNLFRDSLYYNIYELSFNSDQSDYCPLYLNKGLMYVSDKVIPSIVKRYNALNNGGFSNLYYAAKSDSGWSPATKISLDIEKVLHAGPVSFYENNTKAVLNLCLEEGPEPYRLVLYSADYDTAKVEYKNLAPLSLNNNSYSLSHPAISEDGKTIFFVSDMKGGKGGTDLYFSTLKNNQWTAPMNLGDKINSKGDEKYPFITKDHILFFSSDGRLGLGGLDIYYVDLDFKDSVVVNMGFPVNSRLDDFGFSFDKNHKTSYFSSNRNSNGKEDDLFAYTENKILLNLNLFDEFDKKALEGVSVELWDDELDIPVRQFKGKQDNSIYSWLRPKHSYRIVCKKEDYKTDTLKISTSGEFDYSKSIFRTVYIKRKTLYYAALNYQDDESRVSIGNAMIIINNLTENRIDSIDHYGVSMNVKLDADCEYIITSRSKNILRYIYVEKKKDKKISPKSFYNMYLTPAKPTILRIIIKKCSGGVLDENKLLKMKVEDWVNRNHFHISPGPDGDFQFVVTDSRLFDLYLSGNKVLFSNQKIQAGEYCLSFIEKENSK
jgi:tetratricopeptide (TPR) repeat protein